MEAVSGGSLRGMFEDLVALRGCVRGAFGGSACTLPMALTPALSRWTTSRVTEHLRTMLWLLPQFLSIEAALDENKDSSGTVRLQGVLVP